VVGGSPQTAQLGKPFEMSLQVALANTNGCLLTGQLGGYTVDFTAPSGGVSVTFTLGKAAGGASAGLPDGSSQATATTDSSGRASSPPLEANSSAGSFTAAASVTGSKPLTFRLENLAGTPAAITVGGADRESTPTGSRFPIRLAVKVTDKDGNPVRGTLVTFAAPVHGPSGRFSIHSRGRKHRKAGKRSVAARTTGVVRVKTDGKGVAIAPPFTANSDGGGYLVSVRAGGPRAAFALVNQPRS
jgi:hypothetical protein